MKIIKQNLKTTPPNAKELFKAFLFPCRDDKSPALKKGESWEKDNPEKKPVVRSTDKPLCGLDCAEAGLVVVDIDTYKPEFKQSKPAQAFFAQCLKKSQFRYKTPRGGWHFFFKGRIKSRAPFPGVEIKSVGGYVCMYAHPAELAGYETWEDFYHDLPKWTFTEWGEKQSKHREFGPGKNNRAIPQRAGKAGANQSAKQAIKDLWEMFKKNQGRKEFNFIKHGEDYLKNYEKSFFIKTPPENLNSSKPAGEITEKKKKQIIQWVTAPKIQNTAKWLLPGFIPFGAYSVWAGPTGKGRTTTLVNILTLNALGKKLPGTDQKGDKRPFLYHGPENALSIIQKRVKDTGGVLSRDIEFLQMTDKSGKKLPEMQIPQNSLSPAFLEAIFSRKFSAVVCDPMYLLLKDQNKGSAGVLMPLVQACLQTKDTAFIGVCHLKKAISDQEVIHHIRGDSDIVTLSRAVVYMREGKEKTKRVIVPLKNSLTGDLDTGFVTTMADNDSPLSFQHYTDNNFAILKEHAKPFSSFTDAPKDTARASLIADIKVKYIGYGPGKWKTKDFKKWLEGHTKRPWNDMSRTRLMKEVGVKSDKKPGDFDFLLYDFPGK